ncbi:MAG: hypothetical protein JXB19_04755 [Bacteroidales bacterium]|nr:hypothetical protein [Bacteroidales bacterium]
MAKEVARYVTRDTLLINGKAVVYRGGVFHAGSVSFRPLSFTDFFLSLRDGCIIDLTIDEIGKIIATYNRMRFKNEKLIFKNI